MTIKYDYHCKRCGENFKLKSKIDECPYCGNEDIKGELAGFPGIRFKGKNFYKQKYGGN